MCKGGPVIYESEPPACARFDIQHVSGARTYRVCSIALRAVSDRHAFAPSGSTVVRAVKDLKMWFVLEQSGTSREKGRVPTRDRTSDLRPNPRKIAINT